MKTSVNRYYAMLINERTWTGHIISWIEDAIKNGETIFQYATNDQGIKTESGKTKYPDILLYLDKVSGIVFNGWELKYPNTEVDNRELLINALEKAKRLKSDSFVTWNGTEAIIWKIPDKKYLPDSLEIIKQYPKERLINNRKDMSDPENYRRLEPILKNRLHEILHDLEQLYQNNKIKEAINISSDLIISIKDASTYIIPSLNKTIINLKGKDEIFRKEFNKWMILENSTLKTLSTSSKRVENINPEYVLAKFMYYKLVGKILFYLTLSENLSGKILHLELKKGQNIKKQLAYFFKQAKEIDYQAVFETDFTDKVTFRKPTDTSIYHLTQKFSDFDFRILPTEVIGQILENLVPSEEKQKFGQYFTPENLADMVAFPAIKNRNTFLFDPTSGTGTFLISFYNILKYHDLSNHRSILNHVWGNDISHFPSILSVINLYKQDLNEVKNFPRVIRKDFFNIKPSQKIWFPDPIEIDKQIPQKIPVFDTIASNFPFIQQEDIPNKILSKKFEQEFGKTQKSFLKGDTFEINERTDYYTYCIYNSLKFLKNGGYISVITSNAWLGKNYGIQFKKFLLDNFAIKYIVKSNAEHWFKNSKVSTIYIVLKKTKCNTPTKFVTINFKLDEYFNEKSKKKNIQKIEKFYCEIDNCNNHENINWIKYPHYSNVFITKNNQIRVSIVDKNKLKYSLNTQENWDTFFVCENPLKLFEKSMINLYPTILYVERGTRTGWDKMFIINASTANEEKIEKRFLIPVIKNSKEIKRINYDKKPTQALFVCYDNIETLKNSSPRAYNWITKWSKRNNKTGIPLPKALIHTPHWYSIKKETANIFIPINIDKKIFFAYSKEDLCVNQRLLALSTKEDTELITALLNSIISILYVELNGVSRHLGALDLNADFFKTKMKMLNPSILSKNGKIKILEKFRHISCRPIEDYKTEFKRNDRKEFDKTILREYGYDENVLNNLYDILLEKISNRIEMKER